jgi:hypothetical protein
MSGDRGSALQAQGAWQVGLAPLYLLDCGGHRAPVVTCMSAASHGWGDGVPPESGGVWMRP